MNNQSTRCSGDTVAVGSDNTIGLTESTDDLLRFCYAITKDAGAQSLDYFRKPYAVENKLADAFDPVTDADRAVEKNLRNALEQRFPEHNILGEEFGVTDRQSPYCWVIDPIDGTRSFISGMPVWGVLLGLLLDGEPVLGVMHQPYTGETFIAHSPDFDRQAWFMRNQFSCEQPLRVSQVHELADATLCATHPEIFADAEGLDNAFERFQKLANATQLMRYGGDCYCYAMLAMGQIDLVVETGLQAYDILPLIPLVEAAGGVISDWKGEPLRSGGHAVAAASPELHRQALDVLNG